MIWRKGWIKGWTEGAEDCGVSYRAEELMELGREQVYPRFRFASSN
jgi:hypothetical protein